jgi:hypothetical protein
MVWSFLSYVSLISYVSFDAIKERYNYCCKNEVMYTVYMVHSISHGNFPHRPKCVSVGNIYTFERAWHVLNKCCH